MVAYSWWLNHGGLFKVAYSWWPIHGGIFMFFVYGGSFMVASLHYTNNSVFILLYRLLFDSDPCRAARSNYLAMPLLGKQTLNRWSTLYIIIMLGEIP